MKRPVVVLLLVFLGAAALATWLFPRAFPTIAIERRIDRSAALQRADAFLARYDLAPDSARRAIEFAADDSLRTFVELDGGGKDSLDALLRDGQVDLFRWTARAFVAGEVREARVHLSPSGQVRAFRQVLPDSLVRPALDSAAARARADSVLAEWLGESLADWSLRSGSWLARQPGGRIDRTFTYERRDRAVAGAPLRLDIVIAGDLVAEARRYVVIPESFGRRYAEMRSANDLLALLATLGMLGLIVAAMVSLRRYARERLVRWREPLVVGAIGGVLLAAASVNQLPANWMAYDTAGSAALHQAMGILAAVAVGGGGMLLLTLTLAAAEALTRQAFPWHLDWWAAWRYRGSVEVAGRVAGGYVTAAAGFAWVTLFYVVTRRVFGWWVPSALIDDPNLIATPMPWVAGVALAFQAAISEEALFRAVPLSLLALQVARHRNRDAWMAAGVVATAILFGFAHSNYPSWPPYSRGVEIFLEACVWGVLFLRFGLLVPVVAHFAYNLVLFGLFATAGTGAAYRVSAVVLVTVLLSPALAVAWARLRAGGWVPLGDDAWFAQWRPAASPAPPVAPLAAPSPRGAPLRARRLAMALPVIALAGVLARPAPRLAGPAFTADRARAAAVADSMLAGRAPPDAGWRPLTAVGTDTVRHWRRFLRQHGAESLAVSLAGDYAVPAWWTVRWVRPGGSLEERTEEWRVRVHPDGRPFDVRHVIPESAARASVPDDSVRALARGALRAGGLARDRLHEIGFTETARPARRDVTVTYVDSGVALPGGATARVWVTVAGDEVLSARRGVALPEAFVRRQRRAEELGTAAGGACALGALGLIVWGIVRGRRRPFVIDDDPPRSLVLGAGAVLLLLFAGDAAQSVPRLLFQYDTAMTWTTFLTTTAATQVLGLAGVLAVLVLWFLVNGLRRRVGIPLRLPAGGRLPDELLAGLALGSVPLVAAIPGRLLRADALPSAPGTLLDRALPGLEPMLAMVPGAVYLVLMMALPVLAVRAFHDRRGPRQALGGAVLLMAAGAAIGLRHFTGGGLDLARDAAALVTAVAALAAVAAWGGVSVRTWFIASFSLAALQALPEAIASPTVLERTGWWLATALGVALVWLLVRYPAGDPRARPHEGERSVPAQDVEGVA